MHVLVNYNFVIHLLCLKVTSAHVTCIMSHAKLCNHDNNVVISSNAIERHVPSIMNFHVRGWIDIVHILCYTRGSCHDKDSNVMYFLYVKVTSASVRCVIM